MKRRLGFTLLEVMIAAGILVVVLVGLLAAYVSGFELNEFSKNLTFAINAAQQKLEEIRNHTFDSIYNDYNTHTFQAEGINPGNSQGIVLVDNSNPDLLEITVTVCWRQRGNRIIGEDSNLNGVLDTGEDKNGNGSLDSPAQLVTLMTRR